MKIALFGSSGQLGSCLVKQMEFYQHSCWGLGMNLNEFELFARHLRLNKPDAVINAAGLNNRACAGMGRELYETNTWAPPKLAGICADLGIPFYHISTEYVFGSQNGEGPFDERTEPKPDTEYGGSKALGDKMVLVQGGYVIRPAVLQDNFPHTVAASDIIASKLWMTEGCRRVVNFVAHGFTFGQRPKLLHICGKRQSIADFIVQESERIPRLRSITPVNLNDGVPRPKDSSLCSLYPQEYL